MKTICVIPARMGSSRYPGKPLAPILGRPMVEHVYRRAKLCRSLDAVYVATCDEEIRRATEAFGGQAIMTSPAHQRASERVAEAAQHLDADVVVLLQGDEPMTVPEMINDAIAPFRDDPEVLCVNLAKRIETEEEFLNPNTIKVVMDRRANALYFSREPIPTRQMQGFDRLPVFKQVCIIPYRRDFLLEYAQLEPTPLEKAESIDMLRLLEHGYPVRLVETKVASRSVDTPEERVEVEALMRNDPLVAQYLCGVPRGVRE